MKKQTQGILAFIFLGGIMLTSGVLISLPGYDPDKDYSAMDDPKITITGSPADNFPDDQRTTFCSSGGDAKSTDYVTEYLIPTECTNPLAIVSDYDGNAWFAETNTGNLAKFDPITETFTEYDNPTWPNGGRSMIWGIDYAPDGSVWFTDETFDSVWRFSTIDKKYERLSYPASGGDSLPQKLTIHGSQVIINDFTGNKLTILDVNPSETEVNYLSIPSALNGTVTADFALDANNDIWYTNWLYQQGGFLVKFNHDDYSSDVSDSGEQFLPLKDYITAFALPLQLLTPNGITFSDDGILWIADTTSSSFFSFDPSSKEFIQYVTAEPMFATYGNQTGVIQSPISRPYWIENDNQGRLVFNEQTANNISVMDPKSQSLVEYHIPSKNPNWADCDSGIAVLDNCGIAQIFDFAISGEKIWFTEWVENKIGVVDTSVPLPFEIQFESDEVKLSPGDSVTNHFIISPQFKNDVLQISSITSTTHDFLTVDIIHGSAKVIELNSDDPVAIHVEISASDDAIPGIYKILLGGQSSDIAISKFLTVIIG
ncbi:MAG: lyase [Candidatus Nitrosopumilus limneticus]|nr:Lyase [Candidatus Nitrosopumilus limneticus]MDC4212581.1 lyase [Candidatus Nitrosopumilus limneticus]MDC4213412.1 lyase [Candidatus Nitrosopumilus limneticus]MDC4215086.1 lyase [Candidatus Nitrosopumilus limneticus]MDC4215441.1 lyase [Candidatus Nitrosopumilus limneticus]